jgi:hypothetical protein
MRQIRRYRFGGFRHRAKTFARVRAHEALDLGDTGVIDSGRDIDQH